MVSQSRNGWFFLFAASAASGLGNSLAPIAIFSLMAPALSCAAFSYLVQDDKSRESSPVSTYLLFALVQALGFTFGFASAFELETGFLASAGFVFAYGFSIKLLETIFVYLPAFLLHSRLGVYRGSILVFPVLRSTVGIIVIGRVLSTLLSEANTVLEFASLRQFGSIVGIVGIDFIVGLIASVLHHNNFFIQDVADKRPSRAQAYVVRTHTMAISAALVVILSVGGALLQADAFWQKPLVDRIPPSISVSCVLEQYGTPQSDKWERVMNDTHARVLAGDDIVLWSEEALQVESEEEEMQLLQEVSDMVAPLNKTYVGTTYYKKVGAYGEWSNMFVLINPDGSIGWRYAKSFPVPVVEEDTRAGPGILPVVDAPFGRLGGAICFDLDHPEFIRSAGQQGVDIMLQPSFTWGAVGPRHFDGDALRAVENGFTLIRCSSDGVSGVVSPKGFAWNRQYDGPGGKTFVWPNTPAPPRVWTLYPFIAIILELTLFVASIFLWIASFTDEQWATRTLIDPLFGTERHDEDEEASRRPLLLS